MAAVELRSKVAVQVPVLKQIVQTEGAGALWSGLKPRVMFHVPAAAICWGTYESIKKLLAA